MFHRTKIDLCCTYTYKNHCSIYLFYLDRLFRYQIKEIFHYDCLLLGNQEFVYFNRELIKKFFLILVALSYKLFHKRISQNIHYDISSYIGKNLFRSTNLFLKRALHHFLIRSTLILTFSDS